MAFPRPKRRRPVPVWLWVVLASPAFAQDLPPLPDQVKPAAPVEPGAPPRRNPSDVTGRTEGRVLDETDGARSEGDDRGRFLFLDPASRPAPFHTDGAPGFDPTDFAPARPDPKPALPAREPTPPAPAVPPAPPKAVAAPPPAAADPAAVLAETRERLDKLPGDDAKDATASTKALRAVLEARLNVFKDREKAVKDRQDAEHPESTPEKLAAEWKADLERVNATLDQAARDPASLLPASFRNPPAHLPDSTRAEMKEAIEAAQGELKDWAAKLEQFRADPSRKPGAATAPARALRDKSQQALNGIKARNAEREAALSLAKTPEALALARETIVNGQWELRVESDRLLALEARLATETRRAEPSGLNLQVLEAHTRLAQGTLDLMRQRYQALSARQERDLHQAATQEQNRAEHSDDPVERYRARRAAALLELEARVVTNENALATNPPPSYDQQRALADRAETDFHNIKALLDDGKVSRLDALRLNNDFRRLGAERSRITRYDLAAAADRLTKAENALTAVEMELAYDSRDDRAELENLLERVPARLHPRVDAVFRDIESRHLVLLNRRREALDKLAQRADLTHQQVYRRLRILDDHFGFIRTHMFWVRDEDPVGPSTLSEAQRELRQLGRASLRIGAEVGDRTSWGRVSGEFLAASFGLLILPWPLRRVHKALRGRPVTAGTAG